MSKTIDVTIESNGEIKIGTHGFSGPECLKATEFLEKTLGEAEITKTTDFYKKDEKKRIHVVAD